MLLLPASLSLLVTTRLFFVSQFLLHSLVCCIFKIPHIRDIIEYLSFCIWLTSLSIIPIKSVHVITNGKMLLFNDWVVFCCVYVPHLFPLICWWALRSSVSWLLYTAAVNTGVEICSTRVLYICTALDFVHSGISKSPPCAVSRGRDKRLINLRLCSWAYSLSGISNRRSKTICPKWS